MPPLGFQPADLQIVSEGDLLLLQAGRAAPGPGEGGDGPGRRASPWAAEAVDRVLDELDRRDAAVRA
ncbi:hypothetical protein PTW37_07185 [Arthrobacter agilis]|uniref:hypothetical protein n=1 Tax=Arthrobacter agilis TaxID=37921 RepID=UPI002366C087|nr:hypothetical protein [Arthrobacter agilis]WDF34669.1 hypothetical protein PTW37_07185 [Arthrobacter agilis]